ncbi:unnamed protein product [Arabidopsis arenosa]|uniref:Protein kinase domain-containing protein n=1 Tax=Arabidopsis arenosa TaxID=38785 RepID=A0A8S2A2F5_ARAAE|nr:unnamed protein product [Arabidopsis arenosa]
MFLGFLGVWVFRRNNTFFTGGARKFSYQTISSATDRFNIIKGIAKALQYLHSECQSTLIHGNVKSSNVLLDEELCAQLGDYGQGNRQSNTGHVAPELVETTAAHTRDTDVFAFGVLIIEIVCGRTAIEPTRPPEEISLVNWVLQEFRKNKLLECCDARINREELVAREVLLVLKLGLLCTNRSPQVRPVMRKVVQYLDGTEPLPHDD